MNAKRAEPILQGSALVLENAFHVCHGLHFAHESLVANHVGPAAVLPDRQIRLRIADIFVAALSELLPQQSRFCLAFEVLAAVRSVNEIKKPKVRRYLFWPANHPLR